MSILERLVAESIGNSQSATDFIYGRFIILVEPVFALTNPTALHQ